MAAVRYNPNSGPLKDTSGNSRVTVSTLGVGFNGQTPAAMPDYTVSNHTLDRTINETGDTLAQVANVVGTLINDLIAIGLLQ